MGAYALVKDGEVINTVLWGGVDIFFPEDVLAIELGEGSQVSIGYLYKDGKFSPPPLTEGQIEEIKRQAITQNTALKVEFMRQASEAIAPLQDAVDFDMATDEEVSLLKKWKLYRIAVNRIDANTADEITWPDQPQ